MENAKPACAAKGLVLTAQIERELPRLLRGDAEYIRQVVTHLVSNAVKFTDAGTIEIITTCKEVEHSARQVTIDVRDTGIGVDSAALPALFEQFSQADDSLARKAGGAGVGLSICRKVARLMGGEIDVESTPGKGSVFRFSFPCAVDFESAFEIERRTRQPLKILVVDDNHSNLYFMSTLLSAEGHVCDFATDGFEAIRCATSNEYDIILMDVQMPELDGMAAAARIRGMERNGVRVPILAVSAGDEALDRERCAAAGMDGYVSKPVRAALLNQSIKAALTRAAERVITPIAVVAIEPPTSASTAAVTAATLDQDVLNSLFGLFGAEGFQSAIARTLDEATDLVRRIRFAVATDDLGVARRLAHGLKGMAASWGAMRLAEAAHSFERQIDILGDPTGLMDELDQRITEARAALNGASSKKGATRHHAVA